MSNKKTYVLEIKGVKESYDNFINLNDVLDLFDEKIIKTSESEKETVNVKRDVKQVIDQLAKAQEQLNNYDVDYQRELIKTRTEIQNKNKDIRQSIKDEESLITIEENVQLSYRDKQKLLTSLGNQIKAMVVETDADKKAQEELKKQYADLNNELKEFDKSLGNHQRNVGDYAIAGQGLKKELREIHQEMAAMLDGGIHPTDEAFQKLAKRAGEIDDAIGDARREITRFGNDTMVLDDVINVATTATASFGLLTSATTLLGVENENTLQTIAKLNAAMTALNSLQQLQNTMRDNASASYKIYHKALQLLGLEKNKSINQTKNLTKEINNETSATVSATTATKGATTATKGATVATKGATVASKGLSLALKSLGIGLIISAVALLVDKWEDIVGWFKQTFPILNDLNNLFDKSKNVIMGVGNAIIKFLTAPINSLIKTIKGFMDGGIKGAIKAGTEAFKDGLDVMGNYEEGYNNQSIKNAEKREIEKATILDKELDYEIKMNEAKYGSDYKYTQDGIKLYNDYFNNKLKLYNKDSDEYKNLLIDKQKFETDIANKQKAEDDRKKQEEKTKREKAATDAKNELIKLNDNINKMLSQTTKLYEDNNKEKIKVEREALKELNVINQEQLNLKFDYLKDNYKKEEELINDEFKKQLEEVNKQYDELIKKAKEYGVNTEKLERDRQDRIEVITDNHHTKVKKMYDEFASYINDSQKTLSNNLINENKNSVKTIGDDLDNRLKNLTDNINLEPKRKDDFLKLIDLDKTQDHFNNVKNMVQKLVDDLNPDSNNMQSIKDDWNNILKDVGIEFGIDSKEYENTLNEMNSAFEKYAQDYDSVSNLLDDVNEKSALLTKEYWEDTTNLIKEKMGEIQEYVVGPLFETFDLTLNFQLEEVQKKLERVTKMHDDMVEQVNQSQSKINDLNNEMKNSSGERLEELKKQRADEYELLVQKEQQERKYADEKVKMEQEVERKEKQIKKNEMLNQMISSIVNTALGVTKALTHGIPLGPIYAGVIGGMGAVQTGVIASQMAKLEKGGVVIGEPHSNGGVKGTGRFNNIEVEGGEWVINKYSSKKYDKLLKAINNNNVTYINDTINNNMSNNNSYINDTINNNNMLNNNSYISNKLLTSNNSTITTHNNSTSSKRMMVNNTMNKMAQGGRLNYESFDNNYNENDLLRKINNQISDLDFNPVVSVVDINRGQERVARVKDLAGKRY